MAETLTIKVFNHIQTRSVWCVHGLNGYADYTQAVALPRYLTAPSSGYIMPLSVGTKEYDYVVNDGHKNIGAWIDSAARAVGR